MSGMFSPIVEGVAVPFQTSAIQPQNTIDVARVALVIRDHFLDGDWDIDVQKGSLTIKSPSHPDQVVKVFVDYGNRLSNECGLSIHEDPVVVGLELTHSPAYVRECVRDELCRSSGQLYIDPRDPQNKKRWLQPIEVHLYDILFLAQGYCEGEIDEQELEQLARRIERGILSEQ